MGALVEGNKTYIRRFRVTSNERDVLSLRLRVDRTLGSANLQPAGLPRSAVVCIRHLRVSGGVRFDLSDMRLAAAWQAAVAGSIEQMLMRAARPALSAAPSDAPAVVFLDRAELLACIASDWCDGLLLTRWWWRGLLKNDFGADVVKDLWKAAPEYAPAAFAHLARKQKAAGFVQSWNDQESLGLLQDVIRSFALHELMPVVALVQDANRDGKPSFRSTTQQPWQNWVPESDASRLKIGQQLLLSICLLLRRAPTIVRSTDFAREVSRWYRHTAAAPAAEVSDQRTTRGAQAAANAAIADPPEDKVDAGFDGMRVSAGNLDGDSNAPELSRQRSAAVHSVSDTIPPTDSANAMLPRDLPTEDYFTARSSVTEVVGSSQPTQVTEPGPTNLFELQTNSVIKSETVKESEPRPVPDLHINNSLINREQIETRFGGLFYLINLGLYLNLYGDFTRPATPGIELNIWDFVALVGGELVGSNEDPIWPFLAHLAGREADQPLGKHFAPDDSWRIAPEWLTHFSSDEPWKWTVSDGRLRLLHPEGFLVLDLPQDLRDPAGQLRTEIKKYESVLRGPLSLELSNAASLNGDSETVARNVSPEVRAWLARLMAYVRARLRAALMTRTDDEVASLICRRIARVDATDTHVDVFFDLADLPLEIRLSGLDRDPGWVPAAGRFIAFHFD